MMRVTARLLTGVLLAALPLAAQTHQRSEVAREGKYWVQTLNGAAAVKDGGRLVLRIDMGMVEVKTGASDQVEYNVRLRSYKGGEEDVRRLLSSYDLKVRPAAGGLQITGSFPREWRHGVSVLYQLKVPARFNLDLETSGGDVLVERLEGELRAITAGGNIRGGDFSGPVVVETAGGGIQLGNIGQRLQAGTAGGSIRVGDVRGDAFLETSGGEIVTGRIAGGGRLTTAGGDIIVASAGSDLVAETAGGQIRLGDSGGSVRAETAGGSITLQSARGPIRVETAGGCIDILKAQSGVIAATAAGSIRAYFASTRETFQASRLETSYGDIEVLLPADLPVTILATIEQAAGHRIYTDFPLTIEDERGRRFYSGSVRGKGELNGGGQMLRIETVAGNIHIRRLAPGAPEPAPVPPGTPPPPPAPKKKSRFDDSNP